MLSSENMPTSNLNEDGREFSVFDFLVPLVEGWRKLLLVPLLVGGVAVGATYLQQPVYGSHTKFLPPQQAQSSAAGAALASLGALTGLAGGGIRSPIDQYVAMLQSVTVADRIIDRFGLMSAYGLSLRTDVRRKLSGRVTVSAGKKDNLIRVEVLDEDPKRAAEMANAYLDEVRILTANLAVTEAQQRRAFFEGQLKQTQKQLVDAQQRLEATGFSQGALRAEPKAAAESFARLRAEATATEVRIQALRRTLSDNTPEVASQLAVLAAIRGQLAQLEQTATPSQPGADYISRFREFKYQETLFELFARQFELARLDEAREGALFQVIDVATPAEIKTKPKRATTGLIAWIMTFAAVAVYLVLRSLWFSSVPANVRDEQLQRLRQALRSK